AGNITMLDEDRCLFIMTSDLNAKDLYTFSEEDRKKELEKREEEKDYEVLEEVPFWSNGGGFTSGRRCRLCLYSVSKNKITPLNNGRTSITDYSFNEDKTRALVLIDENKGVAVLESKLAVLDLASKKLSEVKIGERQFYDAQFLDDETVF